MFPNILSMAMTTVSPFPMSEGEIAAIKDGRKLMYMLGEIRYKDIFDKPHYTHFCGLYLPKANLMQSCKEYNEAN